MEVLLEKENMLIHPLAEMSRADFTKLDGNLEKDADIINSWGLASLVANIATGRYSTGSEEKALNVALACLAELSPMIDSPELIKSARTSDADLMMLINKLEESFNTIAAKSMNKHI